MFDLSDLDFGDVLDYASAGANIYAAVNQVSNAKKQTKLRQEELNIMKQKEAAAKEQVGMERKRLSYSKGIGKHFANADSHGGYAVNPSARVLF